MRGLILIGFLVLATACSEDTEGAYDSNVPVASPEHGEYLATALNELTQAIVSCLADHGIAATATEDGGVEVDTAPGEDPTPIFELQQECERDLVAAGRIPPPSQPTREYFEGAYAYNLTLKGCLEAEGFEISDPPSLETYIDSYMNPASEGAWAPYNDISLSGVGSARWEELNRICPQRYRPN